MAQVFDVILGDLRASRKNVNETSHQALETIRGKIAGFPDHLARTLPRIDQAISSRPSVQTPIQSNMPASVGDLSIPSEIRTLDAGVRWYVAAWFNGLLVTQPPFIPKSSLMVVFLHRSINKTHGANV